MLERGYVAVGGGPKGPGQVLRFGFATTKESHDRGKYVAMWTFWLPTILALHAPEAQVHVQDSSIKEGLLDGIHVGSLVVHGG